MKATGIVRSVDNPEELVLPMELRRTLGIEISDPLEVYTDEDKIILRKYTPVVLLRQLMRFNSFQRQERICPQCLATLKKQA